MQPHLIGERACVCAVIWIFSATFWNSFKNRPVLPKTKKTPIATLDNALFCEFQKAFEEATGFTLDLAVPGEFCIPEGAPEFCQIMNLDAETCRICRDTHEVMQKNAYTHSHTTECFAGMSSTTIPVKIKGETAAFLSTGHVFLQQNTPRHFEKLRRFARKHRLDPETVERALDSTLITDATRYEAVIRLVEIFARKFSTALIPTPVNYNAIERALRMVREDVEKNWTLTSVAHAVNMNPSYFSDVFRRKTGETFSAYLANIRVEKACSLLTVTRLRIGEIAFACGFRSLSQFNRGFKKATKMSPREFRSSHEMNSS